MINNLRVGLINPEFLVLISLETGWLRTIIHLELKVLP